MSYKYNQNVDGQKSNLIVVIFMIEFQMLFLATRRIPEIIEQSMQAPKENELVPLNPLR